MKPVGGAQDRKKQSVVRDAVGKSENFSSRLYNNIRSKASGL